MSWQVITSNEKYSERSSSLTFQRVYCCADTSLSQSIAPLYHRQVINILLSSLYHRFIMLKLSFSGKEFLVSVTIIVTNRALPISTTVIYCLRQLRTTRLSTTEHSSTSTNTLWSFPSCRQDMTSMIFSTSRSRTLSIRSFCHKVIFARCIDIYKFQSNIIIIFSFLMLQFARCKNEFVKKTSSVENWRSLLNFPRRREYVDLHGWSYLHRCIFFKGYENVRRTFRRY